MRNTVIVTKSDSLAAVSAGVFSILRNVTLLIEVADERAAVVRGLSSMAGDVDRLGFASDDHGG